MDNIYSLSMLSGNVNVKSLLIVTVIPDLIKKITEILSKEFPLKEFLIKYLYKLLIYLGLKKKIYEKQFTVHSNSILLDHGDISSKYALQIIEYLKFKKIKGEISFIDKNGLEYYYNQKINLSEDVYLFIEFNDSNDSTNNDSKLDKIDRIDNYKLSFKYAKYRIYSEDQTKLNNFFNELINFKKEEENETNLFYYMGSYLNLSDNKIKSYDKNKNYNKNYKNDDNDDENEKKLQVPDGYFQFEYYYLCNNKTFETLFLSNKEKILKFIDDFKNLNGIFKFKNIDNKLGILLYGPPGTGKTTFIKCLSHYLNRHVISIPMSEIKTNKQFFDLIMNAQKSVKHNGVSTNEHLYFKKIIYVIEDMDAINSVISTRSTNKNDNEIIYEDQLNIAGILNTLDGVVDTPDRVIIFTTNHIDHIDPALLRPGRIDLKIKLDYIEPDVSIEMIKYYFSFIEKEDEEQIKDFIKNNKISPAVLEQYIKSSTNINDLIKIINNKEVQ